MWKVKACNWISLFYFKLLLMSMAKGSVQCSAELPPLYYHCLAECTLRGLTSGTHGPYTHSSADVLSLGSIGL